MVILTADPTSVLLVNYQLLVWISRAFLINNYAAKTVHFLGLGSSLLVTEGRGKLLKTRSHTGTLRPSVTPSCDSSHRLQHAS